MFRLWCKKVNQNKLKRYKFRMVNPISDGVECKEILAHFINVNNDGTLLFYRRIDSNNTELIYGVAADVLYDFGEIEL